MFAVLKIVGAVITPLPLIIAGMVVGVWWMGRAMHRRGRIVVVSAIALLYALSIQPTAWFLAWTLERSVSSPDLSTLQSAEAIVVLGGGVDTAGGVRRFPELGGASWRRFWHGLERYYALGGALPILYSGGSGDPYGRGSPEAELVREYALTMAIPADRFWGEPQSRDTYENAIAVRRLLDERFPGVAAHRIALVTSARHMPRALATMRRAGLVAIPDPADFESGALMWDVMSFIPSAAHLSASTASMHEWIGMVVYRLRGRM